MCNTCNNEHQKREADHLTLPIDVCNDNSLNVSCKTHKTKCQYICCQKYICTYCVHRDHAKHNSIKLDDEIKNMKERLNIEIEKYELLKESITKASEYIPIAKNLFEESIKVRKQSCITSYISLLNTEENKLREQFNVILNDYKRNLTTQNLVNLKELSTKTEIEFTLFKDNIMESIEQLSFKFRSFNITLNDSQLINDHPLGDLNVDRMEVDAADPDGPTSFRYHDDSMNEPTDPTEMLRELGEIYQHGKFNRNIAFHFVRTRVILWPLQKSFINLLFDYPVCQLLVFPCSTIHFILLPHEREWVR